MTEQQAYEVVTLIKASTASRVEQSTVDYFSVALLPLDYDIALATASIGTITWRRFPPWADFKEGYRAQQRLAEPVGEQRQDLPSSTREPIEKRGEAAPEWVWIWTWARLQRDPADPRWFPQQESQADPSNLMSLEDYEELREEWKKAGSPKAKNPIPMAR